MSYAMDSYEHRLAIEAAADERAAFIRRTYLHVALAILAFVGLEAILLQFVTADMMARVLGRGNGSWLVVLLAFMGVSWLASYWAQSGASPALQYAGLGLYVVAEAIIFVPLLYLAMRVAPDVIPKAGALTLALFCGLTVVVFVTRHDFSYLRTILVVGGILGLVFIVMSMFAGFTLGLGFAFLMAALACGFILYDTSNVLHHYRTDQHVAASLALFASVALLFWYVLRIFLSSSRD